MEKLWGNMFLKVGVPPLRSCESNLEKKQQPVCVCVSDLGS